MDSGNVMHICADVRLIFVADVVAEGKASYALLDLGLGKLVNSS